MRTFWLLGLLLPGFAMATPTAWNEGLNASWLRMEMPAGADVRLAGERQGVNEPVDGAVVGAVVGADDLSALGKPVQELFQDPFQVPFQWGQDIDRSRFRPVRLVLDESGKRTDLSVFDMQHNFEIASKGYAPLFKELRVPILNRDDLLPVFSLYRPASDICYLGINRSERQWRRLTEKLNLFDPSDDLTVIQEIAAAHEVGHCVAARYIAGTNQRWSITQRELFADIFALQHVQSQYSEDDANRFHAFDQLARFRAGGPKDATGPTPRQLATVFERMEEEGVVLLGAVQPVELLVERVVELMGVALGRAASKSAPLSAPFSGSEKKPADKADDDSKSDVNM